jgi:hypothetical protein
VDHPKEIPPELLPNSGQKPPGVKTEEQRLRFNLCFAITRLVLGSDMVLFCRELYASDLPTGSLSCLGRDQDGQEDLEPSARQDPLP